MSRYYQSPVYYENCTVVNCGYSSKYQFKYSVSKTSPKTVQFLATKVTPTVEGNFVWAQKGASSEVLFIRNGQMVETASFPSYRKSDCNTVESYLNCMFDRVASRLHEYNRDAEFEVVRK